ncbi:hypothetical protein P8452_03319 [Trifolium repens]|nr:hypothetical protein P8452_03319 [Trifolium repens]
MPRTLLQMGNVFVFAYPPLFCSALGLRPTSHDPAQFMVCKGKEENGSKVTFSSHPNPSSCKLGFGFLYGGLRNSRKRSSQGRNPWMLRTDFLPPIRLSSQLNPPISFQTHPAGVAMSQQNCWPRFPQSKLRIPL